MHGRRRDTRSDLGPASERPAPVKRYRGAIFSSAVDPERSRAAVAVRRKRNVHDDRADSRRDAARVTRPYTAQSNR